MNIEAVITERAKTHGNFLDNASSSQSFQAVMRSAKNWDSLDNDQRESLQMIAHKIGRILAGDCNFHDHWHDIAGYAELVAKRLDKCRE